MIQWLCGVALIALWGAASSPTRADTRACAKLEASQALDPGAGTLLNLGECYEKAGQTASAWALFREAISAARNAGSLERERIARQRVQELEPRLSYLTIVTWKGQDVTVSRDGVVVDAAVLGTAIPVDPGPHVVSAAGPGKRSWSTEVAVGERADRVSVSIPILPNELQAANAALGEALAPPPKAAASAHAEPSGSVQRLMAIIVAAVGVGGVATGGVFGIKAVSNWNDAKTNCQPYPYCGEAGSKLAKDAEQSGTISTVAFVAGGVGLVSGALLWFTAPTAQGASDTRTRLGLGAGAVTLRGGF